MSYKAEQIGRMRALLDDLTSTVDALEQGALGAREADRNIRITGVKLIHESEQYRKSAGKRLFSEEVK